VTRPLPPDAPPTKKGRKKGPPTVQITVRLLASDVAVLQALADAQSLPLSRCIAVVAHQRATETRGHCIEDRANSTAPERYGEIVEARHG
jgi:hypothetical protein